MGSGPFSRIADSVSPAPYSQIQLFGSVLCLGLGDQADRRNALVGSGLLRVAGAGVRTALGEVGLDDHGPGPRAGVRDGGFEGAATLLQEPLTLERSDRLPPPREFLEQLAVKAFL